MAMQGLWQDAIAANRAILELVPEDVEAYNRLGRAFTEMGEYVAAKEAYGRALELDQYNSIAKKNLKRLSQLGESVPKDNHHKVIADGFIEETSKARVVNLVNLGPRETLMRMSPGEEVDLQVEGQRLAAHNEHNEYIGEIEPTFGPSLSVVGMSISEPYAAWVTTRSRYLSERPTSIQVKLDVFPSHPGRERGSGLMSRRAY